MASGKVIRKPWVGFVHEVPHHSQKHPDLERLLCMDTWKASEPYCLGLWTLSAYQRDYLRPRVPFPVSFIHYPTDSPDRKFAIQRYLERGRRNLVFVSEYLCDYDAFAKLEAPNHRKMILGDLASVTDVLGHKAENVELLERVSDDQYYDVLQESVVFLCLLDAPANTTIVECIVRATPILVNNIGGVEEYLGSNYPFYYDTLEEASQKLADDDLIAETVRYLRCAPTKKLLSYSHFKDALQNSAIYRSLPVPRKEQTDFVDYDVTVLICSYMRSQDLPGLLERLVAQSFEGTFEVILWNNNIDRSSEIDQIIEDFEDKLDLRVIHSSTNYLCIIRLAIASLMHSKTLLICDDDVYPGSDFIAKFVSRSVELGRGAALCARGSVFLPHSLDEENPERVWATGENLLYFDQAADDQMVHYMYADACLIPKELLARAVKYQMPRADFALVDDYWLSFVLSHFLKADLWKIKCDDVFTSTPSAEDPEIGLQFKHRVREELVNMYVHHMRAGWPSQVCDHHVGSSDNQQSTGS